MELYFLATGNKKHLDFFETQMQCLRFPLDVDVEGKNQRQIYYGMLEPINLYRYIFPAPSLNVVLNTLGLPHTNYSMFDAKAAVLRKIMGAKKIPKPETKNLIPINKEHIALLGVGIKEDSIIEYKNQDGILVKHEGI